MLLHYLMNGTKENGIKRLHRLSGISYTWGVRKGFQGRNGLEATLLSM